MTNNRPNKPKKPVPRSSRQTTSDSSNESKPYQLISLPQQRPQRRSPVGQDKLNHYNGILYLELTVKTPTFVASGVIGMGSDISDKNKSIPLIKLATTQGDKVLIPGSSFKGTVRSIYEAITQSCLCKTEAKKETIPNGYQECKDKTKLCPACQVFGAMGWQGLISFHDAIPQEIKPSVGFMPSLYDPRSQRQAYYKKGKIAGRKFYYNTTKAVDKGKQGIPVQQAGTDLIFSTQLGFKNLTQAQLGTLLIALGQDKTYPFALKTGGGKPIGMGTIVVNITQIDYPNQIKDRYLSYDLTDSETLSDSEKSAFIQQAIQASKDENLVQTPQLKELYNVLQYPTTRKPPEGMY